MNKDHDRLAMGQAGDYNYSQTTRKDNTVILRLATNVPGWACTSKGSTKDAWGDDENHCSEGCFLNVGFEKPHGPTDLTLYRAII